MGSEMCIRDTTTMPSGGFGTTDDGIMHFDDAIIESIVMVFMLLTCINFSLLYFAFSGRSKEIWKDEELRTYLLIVFIAWVAMAINIYRSDELGYGFMESIRHSIFQAISITSTGYSSANFSDWPVFSQFVLLLLMIIGASAGSTGGGLKVLRIRIAFELAKREVMKIIQPRRVVAIRFNRSVVDEERVWIILVMGSSWLVLVTASMLTISFLEPNLDMDDLLSADGVDEDILEMSALASDAIKNGAFGFTTSRTINHRTSDGNYVPQLEARENELIGIAKSIGKTNKGVLQVVSDFLGGRDEYLMLEKMVIESKRPLSITVAQTDAASYEWKEFIIKKPLR